MASAERPQGCTRAAVLGHQLLKMYDLIQMVGDHPVIHSLADANKIPPEDRLTPTRRQSPCRTPATTHRPPEAILARVCPPACWTRLRPAWCGACRRGRRSRTPLDGHGRYGAPSPTRRHPWRCGSPAGHAGGRLLTLRAKTTLLTPEVQAYLQDEARRRGANVVLSAGSPDLTRGNYPPEEFRSCR